MVACDCHYQYNHQHHHQYHCHLHPQCLCDIYDCVYGGAKADLSWTFTYESTSHTKPYKVKYVADYTGGSCDDTSVTFDN